MLRLLVLALILANSLYFAWSHGLLRAYGFAPATQSEPQRLAAQLRPEAVRLLSSSELKALEAQAVANQAPKTCWQAGTWDASQAAVVRRALEATAWPQASWRLEAVEAPAHWIVYMGRFPHAEALARKRAELVGMKLRLEPLGNPALEPGLSLGGFATREAAAAALARLQQRGIRTARVVQEREPGQAWQLTLPALTEAMKARLDEVTPALAGKPLQKCD